MFKVTCEYSNETTEQDKTENPLDEPVKKRWSFRTFEAAVSKDKDGNVIKNRAGDRMTELKKDDCRPALILSYNVKTFNPSLAFQYTNAVNQATFGGFAPERTAKVAGIEADEVTATVAEKKLTYWAVSVEIHFNRNTWDLQVLNEGLREKRAKAGGGFEVVPIKVNGVEVSTPVPLAADGSQLPSNGSPFFDPWKVYDEVDFSVFTF